MKSRIFFKLLLSFLLVILIATFLVDLVVMRGWEKSYTDQVAQGLEEKARLVGAHARNLPPDALQALGDGAAGQAHARVTLIAPDGRVLADSEADPSRMENHATRPEFATALQGRTGQSTRWSSTLRTDFLYVAVPGGPGAVRLAYPLTELENSRAQIRARIWGASATAAMVALLMAGLASFSISRRLGRILQFSQAVADGNLSARAEVSGKDEISMLARALNATALRLQESFRAAESSRSQLAAVLDGMEEGVVAVDRDKTVIWANQSLERILGLNRPLVPGRPLIEYTREPEVHSAADAVLENGQPVSADLPLYARDRYLKISCAPMMDAAGSVTGAVAVFHDVTQVERLERIRKDFVANVSHELRTPLTAIRGYTETLLEGAAEEPQRAREFLGIIRTHTERMERMTADLLTLSQLEAGRHEFRFVPILVAEVLDFAVETVRGAAESKQVRFRQEKPPKELRIRADEEALHQALLNLLDNAIKYTEAGGEIVVGALPRDGGVEFFVRDTGIGIATKHQPRIFERFYRVDKARSREAGGTGLGLAITRHIVRGHGGDIHIESEPGRGSRFSFVLPQAVETNS